MLLISQPAPDFLMQAVSTAERSPFTVARADYAGSWLLLLFYPRDFSFVCPTELTSFSSRNDEFQRRNCRLLGASVDSIESHIEWLSTAPAEGGLGALQFPLASDPQGKVARSLGIWLAEEQVSTRGLFLIDPQGIVQYCVAHNLSVGRNVDEALRVLDAMQSGGLCPASWTSADGTIDMQRAIQPGRVVGHYRIKRRLGEGASSSVFEAWDMQLERHVALKVLKRLATESRDAMLREARTAAPLNHANTCGIYGVEEQDGLSVIVMELVSGRSLTELITDRLPEENRLQIAQGIAAGLTAAHALHIVHGDLKPANILVTGDLIPKILDFGLSSRPQRYHLNELTAQTPSPSTKPRPVEADDLEATVMMQTALASLDLPDRVISGTPAYMAPEQWRGSQATPASDVYSFGLVFFELMTGRPAMTRASFNDLIAQLRDPQLAVSLSKEVPLRFRDQLVAMLSPDPTKRPSAAELTEALAPT